MLGVFVVNAGAFLFWWLIRRVAPAALEKAFAGFYLVLMPIGFLVWFNSSDLTFWSALALAMAGLVILSLAVRRALGRGVVAEEAPGGRAARDE